MNKIRVFFFSNIRALLSIFKKVQGGPLKQSHQVFYKKRCSQKLLKIHRKTPLVTQSLFFKKSIRIYNFSLTKEIPTQAFSCQLSKMFKTFFFQNPSGQLLLNFSNENKASENNILTDGFTYSEVSHTDHIAQSQISESLQINSLNHVNGRRYVYVACFACSCL